VVYLGRTKAVNALAQARTSGAVLEALSFPEERGVAGGSSGVLGFAQGEQMQQILFLAGISVSQLSRYLIQFLQESSPELLV
jgi:hypothetical protein